jgi:hypothetical protein
MAYESNKVIPKETLSPESTGRRNTNGFIKENNSVGNTYVRPSGGNGAYYGIKRIASCVYNC